jgi:hypothetical protein
MDRIKIIAGGCSHSSFLYGNPWHYYMGKKMGAEIVSFSSGASGNEMNIEKIKFLLDKNLDVDMLVIQLTEPSRFVFGLNPKKPLKDGDLFYLHSLGFDEGIKYHTFTGHGNEEIIKRRYNYDIKFDKFFNEQIALSEYNSKLKIFHTIMTINELCKLYNKKVIFFSWFVDLHMMAKEIGYDKIIQDYNILTGFVNDFITNNKIKMNSLNGHYGLEEHEKIFEEFINPQLQNLI